MRTNCARLRRSSIVAQAGGDTPGPVHAYCTAIPGPEEFETLFEAMDARRDAARADKP